MNKESVHLKSSVDYTLADLLNNLNNQAFIIRSKLINRPMATTPPKDSECCIEIDTSIAGMVALAEQTNVIFSDIIEELSRLN
jgi:hypothetical protein